MSTCLNLGAGVESFHRVKDAMMAVSDVPASVTAA